MRRHEWAVLCLLLQAPPARAQPAEMNIPAQVLEVYANAYAENWGQFGGGFHQVYFYLLRTIRTTARGTKTVWSEST